jgi:nucleotide-binding universal stress UspA family protein
MSGLVVGYDGTDGARVALDEALRLAVELGGVPVHIVFAFASPRLGGELRDLDEAIAERGQELLRHAVHHVEAAGSPVEVTTQFIKSEPAEGLISAAQEHDARFIVVGSYGEKPLRSALVGATPTRLLHLSDRPVLVVLVPE